MVPNRETTIYKQENNPVPPPIIITIHNKISIISYSFLFYNYVNTNQSLQPTYDKYHKFSAANYKTKTELKLRQRKESTAPIRTKSLLANFLRERYPKG